MKSFVIAFFALCITSSVTSGELNCQHEQPDIPKEWIDMTAPCVKAVKDHVKEEIQASLTYLSMGAYFAKDTVNKPGFSEKFFKAADEERTHATQFIAYLLWRGYLVTDIKSLVDTKSIKPVKASWKTGLEALKDALILEANVTEKIKAVIKECESPKTGGENDYHIVDYLTGEFLQEQNEGEHQLAREISKLDKLKNQHGALSEFLFDKELLGNSIL
jgi:ferritin heavy chain